MNPQHTTIRRHDWLHLLGSEAEHPRGLAMGIERLARLAVAEHQAQAALALTADYDAHQAARLHAKEARQ